MEAAIRYRAEEMGLLEEIHAASYGVEPAYSNIAFSPALPESPKVANQLCRPSTQRTAAIGS